MAIGQGRETNLERSQGRRAQRRAVLIATNGKSTERKYFDAVKALPWVHAARVAVVFTNGAPTELVRDTARRRDLNDFDEAWAVCDVDEYLISEPSATARRLKVKLAWSNPSFEVWLILHHDNCTSHLENGTKACQRLEKYVGKWNKSTLNFSQFEQGISDAVTRAKELEPSPDNNPSSGIWRLMEALGHTQETAGRRTRRRTA
ncbi:RloB family protein [Dactylosporangium sp. NPDC000555]|uniref:RloB family protein n=1 Tax=Dactylosporangium sp. NPDC000555 TaxID=3154260 RepID=UPI003319E2A8